MSTDNKNSTPPEPNWNEEAQHSLFIDTAETIDEGTYYETTRKPVPVNTMCFFLGHTVHDNGFYQTCDHCGAHEFYDGYDRPWHKRTWFATLPTLHLMAWVPLKQFLQNAFEKWLYKKCCDCNKPEKLFGKHVGDHRGCLPF